MSRPSTVVATKLSEIEDPTWIKIGVVRCALCARTDAMYNSAAMHVLDVQRGHRKLMITVERGVGRPVADVLSPGDRGGQPDAPMAPASR